MTIISFNSFSESYFNSSRELEISPSVEMLFSTLKLGVRARSDFSNIENIFNNGDWLEKLLSNAEKIENNQRLIELLTFFWDTLSEIRSDFEWLECENLSICIQQEQIQQKSIGNHDNGSELKSIPDEIKNAYQEYAEAERNFELEEKNTLSLLPLDCAYFPFPSLLVLNENNSNSQTLSKYSAELSKYFATYFNNVSDDENNNLNSENFRLSEDSKHRLLRIICSFLIAASSERFDKASGNVVNNLLHRRRKYTERNIKFSSVVDAATVTALSANLLFAIKYLELDDSFNEFLSSSEKNLKDFGTEFFQFKFPLSLLPQNGLQLILGHSIGTYFLPNSIVSKLSFSGYRNSSYQDLHDELTELYSEKISASLISESELDFLFQNLSSWNFKVEYLGELDTQCNFDLLDDYDFIQIISKVLHIRDKNSSHNDSKLPSRLGTYCPIDTASDVPPLLLGKNRREDILEKIESETHPALVAACLLPIPSIWKLGNWIKLSQSFLTNNQAYFAALTITLLIESLWRLDILIDSSESEEVKVDLLELEQQLVRLAGFPVFNLIENAIIKFCTYAQNYDALKGCLKAFLNPNAVDKEKPHSKLPEINLVSSEKKSDDRLNFLNERSRHHFERGLSFLENPVYFATGIADYAHMEFAKGLEIELNFYMPEFTEDVQSELNKMKIRFNLPPRNQELATMVLIAKNFHSLSERIKKRMPLLNRILESGDSSLFLEICDNIRKRRNKQAHTNFELANSKQILLQAKSELLDDGLFRILSMKNV